VQCESCLRWHYRVCGTGITQEQYRRANKGIEGTSWVCESCSCIVDRANSTAVTDISRLTSLEVSVITDDLVEEMVADEARDQTYIITGTTEPSVFQTVDDKHPYVAEVMHSHENPLPSVMCYTDQQATDFKAFITSHDGVVGVDRTFSLGKGFVTTTVYKSNKVTRANIGEPLILLSPLM